MYFSQDASTAYGLDPKPRIPASEQMLVWVPRRQERGLLRLYSSVIGRSGSGLVNTLFLNATLQQHSPQLEAESKSTEGYHRSSEQGERCLRRAEDPSHSRFQHPPHFSPRPMAHAAANSSGPPNSTNGPLLAQGDWTKNLVHLAKTAELKKHALTLQLHTAHILSAHAALDQKGKAIQDVKEQKQRSSVLDSAGLTTSQQADLTEATLNKECTDLRNKIQSITDGEYATAKEDVDRLRQELGQPALPSLQTTLEEKSAQYLKDLRLQAETLNASAKRPNEETGNDGQPTEKRRRGRPKGSKTKTKTANKSTAAEANTAAGPGSAEGATATST
ncbi:hypothetical protein NLI96_g8492 [Meripilus lineatus]|uniref:Uncharacterized protein n=1 Tax=Meripilus lineatus TaxID=2056292 RepID=A0AAD5YBY7_9APHY|nr:hypothetical protein NLI96_g8492 [Physisporinus lineatus]